jgi:hypothetical protein
MLPSSRTIKYIEALAREGDQFNYEAWLTGVRQEEAEDKAVRAKALAASAEAAERSSDSLRGQITVRQAQPPRARPTQVKKVKFLQGPAKSAPKAADVSLGAQLFSVNDTWDRATEDRYRDSIYAYLKAVYALVWRCKRDGQAKELLRSAIRIAGLTAAENAELFATVIRATCDDKLDQKMVSKYSRALRYAASRDRPPRTLVEFIKRRGGINAVADRYARKLGRRRKAE